MSHQQWYETCGMHEEWCQWRSSRKPKEVSKEWEKSVNEKIDELLAKEKDNVVIE